MRKTIRYAIAAFALLAMLPARLPAQGLPVDINVILSLSGSGAFLGQEESDAIKLVEKNVNRTGGIHGRPVNFIIKDDQSSPQIALQLFNAMLPSKPNVVIGSSLVASCSAIFPLIATGPVVYCLSAAMHPPAGSYMFAYGVSTTETIRVTLEYFRMRGWKRVAGLFTSDATGQDGENAYDSALLLPRNAGMVSVAKEHFALSELSVAAQLAHINQVKPQAILLWVTGTGFGTALRGAKELGLDIPIGSSASNLNYKVMKQYASILPRDLFMATIPGVAPQNAYSGPLKAAAMKYYASIKATGTQPDANMAVGWDSATIVVNALQKLGADASPADLRAYISSLHDFYGAAGQYDLRDGSQRGATGKTEIIVRFDPVSQIFTSVSRVGGAPIQ